MSVRLLTSAAKILLALESGSLTYSDIVKKTGLSPGAVDLNLKKLLLEGMIEKKEGKYRITDKGRKLLDSLKLELKLLPEG